MKYLSYKLYKLYNIAPLRNYISINPYNPFVAGINTKINIITSIYRKYPVNHEIFKI